MLTQRQHQLLRYIFDYQNEHGVPPSFEEMRDALRLKSKSGIHRLITGLEERGYLRRLAYRARALEIVRLPPGFQRERDFADFAEFGEEDDSNVVHADFGAQPTAIDPPRESRMLPLYGRIAAGTPIESLRDPSSFIEVPPHLLKMGDHYALEVVGDSMIEAGIQDGDVVVVQRAETAENGEIVVALIDGNEVTLKRFRRKGKAIALEAANAAYETRIFGDNRVRVQGRLVGLLRRY